MIDICLLGTGGMLPLPGRALTSLYVRCGSGALLIDCGEGTQTAIRTAGLRFKPIDAILITHFHADHISGLPGLLLTLGNEGRTEPLHMHGPEGLAYVVNALRVIAPGLPYEIVFHEYPCISGASPAFRCGNMEITAIPLDHGMPCFGWKIALPRTRRFDPDAARAKGVPVSLWSRLQKGESAAGFFPDDVLGPARRGLSLVYATDTRPVPAIADIGRDADLMILEGMFADPDKQSRADETHHMMMQEAAQIARSANARELWLTHFSPATDAPAAYADAIRAIFPNTTIPDTQCRTTLQFSDC